MTAARSRGDHTVRVLVKDEDEQQRDWLRCKIDNVRGLLQD